MNFLQCDKLLFIAVLIISFSNQRVELLELPEAERLNDEPDEDYMDEGKIINGTVAKSEDFPYYVEIWRRCGGVLVGEKWVLTAKHCVMRANEVFLKFKGYTDKPPIFVVSEKFVKHPNFDIAMIKVPKITRPDIRPIKIDEGNLVLPRSVLMIGKGLTETGRLSESLRIKEVFFDPNECEIYGPKYDPKNFYCVSHKTGTGCRGDSGGPVVAKGQNLKDDTLIGIISGGDKFCDMRTVPGIVFKVRNIAGWVKKVMTE